jgi:hypothetical protein
MAEPVTVVVSGGVPVVDATPLSGTALTNPTTYGVPVTPVESGARPVTIVASGAPPIVFIAENGVDYLLGGSGESVVVPAAPVLVWASLETDDEPDFEVDLPNGNVDPIEDAAEGDHLIFEYQLQSGGAWTEYLDHTLTAGDITDDDISVPGVDSVADGDYFFRARLERGALIGTNSASVEVTIDTVLPVPVNSVAPVISGNTQVTETLTTTDGTWSNTPTGYTYQWKRDGSSIGSATANTYALVELDAGADITCEVLASNASGPAASAAASNTLGIDVYLVFLAHIEDSSDQITYSGASWQGISLGTAAANRKIIVGFTARNSGGTGGVVNAATVAGQSALPAQITANSDTANNKAVIMVADVTAGTTGNISIGLTVQQNRAGAGVWAMYGAGSSTATDTDKTEGAADGNVTLTVPAKGVAIGVSYHQAAGTASWTGLTGRYDAALESTIEHAGADLNSNAGGNINMISDWSAADTAGAHAFASWGP